MKSETLLDTMTSKLEKLVSTKTVVGEPVVVGDVTLVPIQTASFGFGSGGGEGGGDKDRFGGGAGAGVSLRPIAIISVKDGSVQVHSLVEPKTNLDRFAEIIPQVLSKVTALKGLPGSKKKTKATGEEEAEESCETEECDGTKESADTK